MQDINWLFVAVRWLHVVAAIVALGGSIFIRFVLMPSAKSLPDPAHQLLHDAVRRRWAMIFGICVLLLLGTGLFNYMAYAAPLHHGQAAYNGLIGVKILLALIVFFLGSALVGRARAFESIRRSAPMWLTLNILLALAVVALAAALKFIPTVHP